VIHEVLSGVPSLKIDGLPAESTISKTDGDLNPQANRFVMKQLALWLSVSDLVPVAGRDILPYQSPD
jgi:hypothetical protein